MSQGEQKVRLVIFRVVAVIGGVLHALPVVFLAGSLATTKERIHVVHNTAEFAMFAAVISLGWILAAVAPERMIAPFQAATLTVACVAVASVLSADPRAGVVTALFAIILLVLHPARSVLWRMGRTAPAPLVLAALAVVPAIWFALSNASLQRNGAPTDPHVEMHRWTGIVAFALTVVMVAVVAGLGGRNRRIVAVVGGLSAASFGVISLINSGYPGAVTSVWAVACIAWGATLAGDGSRMARDHADVRAPVPVGAP